MKVSCFINFYGTQTSSIICLLIHCDVIFVLQAKKSYEKRFSDSERALDAYQRADADINLSRAEVEKVQKNFQRPHCPEG